MKKLMDVCDIQYGYAFDSKKFSNDSSFIPLIRIRDVKRGYSETFYSGTYSKEYIVHRNDLLIGMDGEFNIARWNSNEALLNQRVCKIVAKNGTNEEYLRFAMSRKLKEIEEKTSFVTVKHLSAKELKKIVLKMPNIEKQSKISNILVKLEDTIKVYKKELEKLNSLIQARFIELFGDPKYNALKWPIYMLGDLFTIGSSKRIYQSEQVPEGIPFLRISDLMNKIEKADESANLFISEELYEELQERDLVPVAGDILVTSRGTLGQCYEIKEQDKFYFQDGMISWLYNRDEKITNNYLMFLFQMPGFRLQIDEVPEGSTVNYLSIARLKNLRIMCPSIELQQQFAAFVVKVNKSKFVIHKFLYCATHNTQSIIKPRPNTKESGKTRGGKPYADEF